MDIVKEQSRKARKVDIAYKTTAYKKKIKNIDINNYQFRNNKQLNFKPSAQFQIYESLTLDKL